MNSYRIYHFVRQGQPITRLGTTSHPWQLTVTLRAGGSNPAAVLSGNTTVSFIDGFANFTDLTISHYGNNYILDFDITYPTEGNLTLESSPMTIATRPVLLRVTSVSSTPLENSYVSMSMELIDGVTNQVIEDIAWRVRIVLNKAK